MVFDDRLGRRRLLALTTFDDSGGPVVRPLWFAVDGERIVAISLEGREADLLERDPRVEFGGIDRPGQTPETTWRGTATRLRGDAASAASRVISRKYGLRRRVFRFFYWFTRSRHHQETYLEIRPEAIG